MPTTNNPRAYLRHTQSAYSFPISPDGVRIGRSHENQIVIPDSSVSRFHAQVFFYAGRFWVRDLGGASGVYLNGGRVPGQAELRVGDRITIGNMQFILQNQSGLNHPGSYTPHSPNRKKNPLIFLGMFAAAFVILIMAAGSGGGGSGKTAGNLALLPSISAPGNALATIQWGQAPIDVSLLSGTSQIETVSFQSSASLANASISVSAEIAELVQVIVPELGALEVGQLYQTDLVISSPETSLPGSYQGTIQIHTQNRPLGNSLPVRLQVSAPSAAVIPPEVSSPSADKLIFFSPGQEVVKDLLVVGLDLETANPEVRIREIAAQSGGVFIGSIPAIYTYQIRYTVQTLDELNQIQAQVSLFPDVAFASHEFVGNLLSKIPNDKEYAGDAWSESAPAGPNWHLEMVHAPSAWDITTGDSSVKIGVVDVGIKSDHQDLRNNIISSSGKNNFITKWHGTHVSGLIGAEGNNGIGVVGLMWDVSLQTYRIKITPIAIKDLKSIKNFEDLKKYIDHIEHFSPVAATEQMTQAVLDGNRIVNLSIGGGLKECGDPLTPEVEQIVTESNAVYSQAILFGMKTSRDVLWVIAAGNACADARYSTTGSLVDKFPMNVITVASVNQQGELSDFSNRGELVSVAAPGGNDDPSQDVLSTLVKSINVIHLDDYDGIAGTSMAAPIVSGIAGLVLSQHPDFSSTQIKQCILAGARTRNHQVPGQPFYLVDAELAVKCEGDLVLPEKVDIVLSIDLTHSMNDELVRIKKEILEVIEELRIKASPSTDFRFAVVSFEDYPDVYSSSVCATSFYSGEYGSEDGGDQPYRLELPLVDDDQQVSAVIDRLELGDGVDIPESYARVFWEIGQAAKNQEINFRPDARKLIVSFGDSVPHDPDLSEGVSSPGFELVDTGIDPGPNAVLDCSYDTSSQDFDLDFQDMALQTLTDAGVRLLHVDSSGEASVYPYWQYWTSLTGGAFMPIHPDGSIPGDLSLSELIMQLLELSNH